MGRMISGGRKAPVPPAVGYTLMRVVRSGPAPSNYGCGLCPSGPHSLDGDLSDALQHAAFVHNRVIRGPRALMLRPPA
jgi:hypothetical protein